MLVNSYFSEENFPEDNKPKSILDYIRMFSVFLCWCIYIYLYKYLVNDNPLKREKYSLFKFSKIYLFPILIIYNYALLIVSVTLIFVCLDKLFN